MQFVVRHSNLTVRVNMPSSLASVWLILTTTTFMLSCHRPSYTCTGLITDQEQLQPAASPSSTSIDNILMSSTPEQEKAALLAFKASITADPLHTLASWTNATINSSSSSTSSDPCRDRWTGVTCNEASHVISLKLDVRRLSGTISGASLSQLPYLTFLNLSANHLSGPVPPELGRLSHLTVLDLDQNQLSGTIPPQLSNCSLLSWLDLSINYLSGSIPPSLAKLSHLHTLKLHDISNLTGPIPPELGSLPLLTSLYLNQNSLTGHIPPQLGNLSTLKDLSVMINQLEGPIPAELGQLQNLQSLAIILNKFSGGIPPELGNLKSLKHFWAYSCNLTGLVPPQLGNLSNLIDLDLSYNHLSGSIPPELGWLPNLQNLRLFQNNFIGNIPGQFGNLTNLQQAFLFGNSFSGDLPPALGRLENLQTLSLYSNEITGLLPAEVGNLTNLQNLPLFDNRLHGQIPSDLGKLRNLVGLYLKDNSFSGTLPCIFGNMANLQYLDMSTNKFHSKIPACLGNLSNLIYLDLSSNQFFGDMPVALTNCTNLQWLKLGNNSLSGGFPTHTYSSLSHLHTLSLANNYMAGALPASFANHSSLVFLDLKNNQFVRSLPNIWAQFENLRVLSLGYNRLTVFLPSWIWKIDKIQVLDLSNNDFSGTISKQIHHMDGLKANVNITDSSTLLQDSISIETKGIEIPFTYVLVVVKLLDLSGNRISGNIPEELGSLNGLVSLNLSRNFLTGAIPASLANISSLESLDLSNNALNGSIPAQLTDLTSLAVLNLSSNNLSGPIPTGKPQLLYDILSITYISSADLYLNNPNLCGFPLTLSCPEINSGYHETRSDKNTGTKLKIILSCIAATVGITAIAFVFLVVRKRAKRMGQEGTHLQVFLTFHPQELFQATGGYSADNIVGEGGFSIVYKGMLRDGTTVAVKRLKMLKMDEEEKSFKAECTTLGQIRHRNLVRVLGSCMSNNTKAVVLEFISNGNLDTRLYQDPCQLDWKRRVNIAIGVAQGLFYLHNETGVGRILHRDLKPSNILLDEEFEPHISDFGIARLITPGKDVPTSAPSIVRGSIGYMAPEYAYGERMTDKGDVYSYGVVLLELLTRKKPIAQMFAEGDINLPLWARSMFAKDWRKVIDPDLLHHNNGSTDDEIHNLFIIALSCVYDIPKDRPSIRQVLDMLWLLFKKGNAHPLASQQIMSSETEASVSHLLPLDVNKDSSSSFFSSPAAAST